MKKIYLATPYSYPQQSVRRKRFNIVNISAARLMRDGNLVFSPISHTHPIAEAGNLPKDWAFWKEYDLTFIEWADEVHVLKQDGWATSIGVINEIKLADELRKPVVYMDVEI